MGIFSTMMWNAIHMATHGLTTVNKRVETLKSCRRHAKGVVTKVISPLRLLVIILLLLKGNIQFHHECYRTIAALLAQQVVHHKLESDSLSLRNKGCKSSICKIYTLFHTQKCNSDEIGIR